jgi:hypothetical protein
MLSMVATRHISWTQSAPNFGPIKVESYQTRVLTKALRLRLNAEIMGISARIDHGAWLVPQAVLLAQFEAAGHALGKRRRYEH